jgi:transcriptional regulator with XRE-family HTH domain
LTALAGSAINLPVTQYFGDRIRELRNEKDLSLRDLAKLIGVSAPFLTDVENRRRYPADDTLAKLAVALGTTVEDLKTYDNRPPTKELTELADEDVGYAFAFRRIVDSVKTRGLSPQEVERQFFASEDPSEGTRRILTGEKPNENEK